MGNDKNWLSVLFKRLNESFEMKSDMIFYECWYKVIAVIITLLE